jgi:AcrR family transcriptional regulator
VARQKTSSRSRAGPPAVARPESERRRALRPALDRERIELAALELVEKDGLAEFSMRKLGAALGVEAMSLYHHFPSKAHLFDALLDRLVVETAADADAAKPWRERARRVCVSYRDLGRRYPEFARFMILHRMNTRGGLAWLEGVVRIFTDAGFDAEGAARAFRSMGYYLIGAMLDETAGYARGPSAADPVPLEEQASLAPTVMKLGPYFQREHWDRTFLGGLELLLDGFERELSHCRSPEHGRRHGDC